MSITWTTSRTGKRFAFVGACTIREQDGGTFDVTLDADGDDVLIGRGMTEAAALAAVTA